MRLIDADALKYEIFDMCREFDGVQMLVDDAPTIDAVPVFAQIAEKWRTATDEAVRAKYGAERDGECDEDCIDLDYYRRSFAYDEIWEMCAEYMWHDELAVHLSLFGYYDFEPIGKFVHVCREKWKNLLEQDGDNNGR